MSSDVNRRLVVTLHGIRTYGRWQQRLEEILREAKQQSQSAQTEFAHFTYGVFDLFKFLIPFARNSAVKKFRQNLQGLLEGQQYDTVDIVAHSFGTYLAIRALESPELPEDFRVRKAILCGSVLPPDDNLSHLVGPNRRIGQIINDCGTKDGVLLMTLLVWGVGMAGRLGSHGFQGRSLKNRFFRFGHSGYFEGEDGDHDAFMKRWWVPALLPEEPVASHDDRPEQPSLMDRLWRALGENGAFVTFAFYVVLLTIIGGSLFGLWRQSEHERKVADMRGLLRAAQTAGNEHAEMSLLLLAEAVDVQQAGDLDDHEIVAGLHRNLKSTPARTIRFGDWGTVQQLVFSPDGKSFLSASSDRILRLWALERDEPQRVLQGHTDIITAAVFDASGQAVASASSDRTIRLWNLRQEAEPQVLEGHTDTANSLAFSPDGTKLVSAAYDGSVRIWDLRDGQEPVVLRGHQRSEVYQATFDPKGEYIVSAHRDGTARLWHPGDSRPAKVLEGHTEEVRLGRFSPDGSLLATASSDGTVRLWTAPTGQPVREFGGKSKPTEIAFSPDGSKLLVGRQDGSLRLWSTGDFVNPTTKPVEAPRRLEGHEGSIIAVRFSEDGSRFATVGGQSIRIWTTDDGGSQQSQWQLGVPVVSEASISPQGTHVVTTSGDGMIRIWDLTQQQAHVTMWRKKWVHIADLSPDSRLSAVADGHDAFIIELRSGGETVALSRHTDNVTQVRFSPDGQKVLTASRDTTLRLWSLDGSPLRTFEGHDGRIRDVDFDPTGRRLASASDDRTAVVWDASAATPPVVLRGHLDTVASVEFSPNGKQVLTSSWDGTARVWDAARGNEVATLRGHWDLLEDAVFSPDGRRVATASRDKTARVWDLADPSRSIVLSGHLDDLSSVSFSPDGSHVVTASRDGNARIWAADGSGQPTVLEGPGGIAGDAYFTADGGRIVMRADYGILFWRADGVGEPIMLEFSGLMGSGTVALSADGQISMTASAAGLATWTLSAAALRDAACQAAGRNLTAIEWSMHRSGPYRKTCSQWPDLSTWSSPHKMEVHSEVRVSGPDKPGTFRLTGRDLNLLFPRELRGTIGSIEPSLALLAPTQVCSTTVTAGTSGESQVWCSAQIECNGQSMYGGGFFPCTVAGPHVRGSDTQVSSADGDPAIALDTEAKSLRIWDDASGYFGNFDMQVDLERPRPPPSFVSSVPWGCMDGTALAPNLPDEANHYAQSWLIPHLTPFVIDEIRYALVGAPDSVCRTGLAHDVVIGTMGDPGPGGRNRTGPGTVTLRIPDTKERSLRPVRIPIDPPITLKAGQAAFVKIQLAASSDTQTALCLQTCETGGRVGLDYWSGSATSPYYWYDVVATKSLRVNHAVYGVDGGSATAVDRLLDLPGYGAIALRHFGRRGNLVKHLQRMVVTDGLAEAQNLAAGYLSFEAMRRASRASDETLIETFKTQILSLETLRDSDALACVQELFPQLGIEHDPPPRANERREAWLKSLSDIVLSAEQRPKARVNAEAGQQGVQRAAAALGTDAQYLAPPNARPDEVQAHKICATHIRLNEHILAQGESAAANTIRWMFMRTAKKLQSAVEQK